VLKIPWRRRKNKEGSLTNRNQAHPDGPGRAAEKQPIPGSSVAINRPPLTGFAGKRHVQKLRCARSQPPSTRETSSSNQPIILDAGGLKFAAWKLKDSLDVGISFLLFQRIQPMIDGIEPAQNLVLVRVVFVFDLDQRRKGNATLQ
jgi:hypothetical protein